MINQLQKYRQDLHQIPEIAFDLFKTHAYIKDELMRMGYQPILMAKTGLVISKEGKSKEAILFRTDMDALPVKEMTELRFKSKHEGNMHACGHDGHMAMMLGFASYVASLKNLNKTIVMIFQPAEEGPGGAKVMIEEGLFDLFDIKAAYGIHLYPELEEGLYGLVDGPMMAQNGEFDVVIEGKSSHGALPHLGNDAILASTALIQGYQSIISRRISALDSAVITVGTIHGGEARNILAKEVKLSGTMRAFDEKVYQSIKKMMHEVKQGIELTYHVKINQMIEDYYPPVINDHQLFESLKKSLELDQYRLISPIPVSEDFAFYQKHVPGVFVMLGTRNEKKGWIHPLHSDRFNFDETMLIKGVELYQKILEIHHVI